MNVSAYLQLSRWAQAVVPLLACVAMFSLMMLLPHNASALVNSVAAGRLCVDLLRVTRWRAGGGRL